MPIPILFVSDAVTAETGLARITRDLAVRVHENLPELFRVGSLGYGGPYSRNIPFPQYSMNMKDWVVFNLVEVWKDFAGTEPGIVFTIWDASRLLWFSRPENCQTDYLRNFLKTPPFKRWGYFPMDATGPNDKLTAVLAHTMEGYDRVLAYSQWAENILRRTLTSRPILDGLTNLPHGIDTSVFQPRHRIMARHGFGEKLGVRNKKYDKWLSIPDDAYAIGIVGTNQARKDFGLGIQTVAALAKDRKIFLWIHTDVLERHWSIPALLNDYGILKDSITTTLPLTDEQMAWCYSALDLTLGIGVAEGFGYPIFESLACGTPCVHGNDGGAAEHLPKEMLVEPVATRLEGPYCCQRNVYRAVDWVDKIKALEPKKRATLPDHLSWNMNWRRWKEWFVKGAEECQFHFVLEERVFWEATSRSI